MKNEKKIVLVVDNSVLILQRMIPMLEEIKNIKFVVHAGSYNEAIELLHGVTPDLALLDVQLPEKSGIELLRLIKDKYREVVVIMNTNYADEYYRNLCKTLGADYFFDKSKDFSLIPEVISAETN